MSSLHIMLRTPAHVQICRTFAQTRSCRYGKRCRFIHPDSSTDLSLLLNAQTDHHMHTLYQSPALSKEPCSQDCCSSTAPPPTPDSLGYASPQAIPQYSGVHPATYQLEDDFLHPVPVTPQAACFDSSQAACFDSLPYTTPYSSSAVPVSSDATCFDASPYTSPEPSLSGSVLDAQGCSLMACLPAPGDVDAISSGLLGCGYSAQESAGLMLGGTGHGGQLKSSPRGVLEYAARQGYGLLWRAGSPLLSGWCSWSTPQLHLLVQPLHHAICHFWLAPLACIAMCAKGDFDALGILTAQLPLLLWRFELIMQNGKHV